MEDAMRYDRLGELALGGHLPSRADLLAVLRAPDDAVPALLDAAFQVRRHHFGLRVQLHRLINAKSGLCPEDCSYCSQSSVSSAPIQKYPWLSEDEILDGARDARNARAIRYCIVSSGRSPGKSELQHLCRAVRRIKAEVGISICASLGLLTPEAALALKEAGVDRYNHNLNASEQFYSEICHTHSYPDRINTLRHARTAGLELCSGAIFGMGETPDDVVDVALSLRELHPDSIPVNFLHPIDGTPLQGASHLTPHKCLTILCLLRLLNPDVELRVAGGREYHLRSLQPLALYPANSIFVSGYLTTSGQTPPEAWQMVADMGFEVEQVPVSEIPL